MIFLEDLLKEKNFTASVDGMAAEFRGKNNLPPIHQLGLVVKDVEKAADKLEADGIGPFFIATGSPVLWREHGTERQVSGKLGIAHKDGIELELLEPLNGSDFYTRCLDPEGRVVVQHIGFMVDDVDDWAGRMKASGLPVWVRGRLKALASTAEFAYMEPLKENGLIMEFICWKLLGKPLNPPAFLFKTLGWIEKWTGKRSIAI